MIFLTPLKMSSPLVFVTPRGRQFQDLSSLTNDFKADFEDFQDSLQGVSVRNQHHYVNFTMLRPHDSQQVSGY